MSFFFDAVRQKADGAVATGPVLGPPLDPFDTELDAIANGSGCLRNQAPRRTGTLCPTIRPEFANVDAADAGSDTLIAPLVGASLELMTPRLLHGFLDPRLFVHGDAALAFAFERNLAGKGSPGEFSVPPYPQQANDMEELSIPGQGSRTRWQLGSYVYSAGGGVAFTLPIFERAFRIKPSAEWLQVEYDFIGVTRRVVKQQVPSGRTDLSRFRQISLNRVKTRTFDGIGAGLELELDTARLGPVQTSLYATGRAYRMLGTLDTTLTASNEFGETATWTAKPERWLFRAGVGFRFRWAPEAE